jgi:hypothetical protein
MTKHVPPSRDPFFHRSPMNTVRVALFLALVALSSGCDQTSMPAIQTAQPSLPFEYTNLVHEPSPFRSESSTETLIRFTNDMWFGHQKNEISMGRGVSDFDIHAFFNPTNGSVRRIVHSRRDGTNNIMIIDSDGDGVPETRNNITTRETELLILGDWAPSRGPWLDREAFLASNWVSVTFTNSQWKIK